MTHPHTDAFAPLLPVAALAVFTAFMTIALLGLGHF